MATGFDLCLRRSRGGSTDERRRETALDPLRGRDDFKLLMIDCAMPAQPFAP